MWVFLKMVGGEENRRATVSGKKIFGRLCNYVPIVIRINSNFTFICIGLATVYQFQTS